MNSNFTFLLVLVHAGNISTKLILKVGWTVNSNSIQPEAKILDSKRLQERIIQERIAALLIRNISLFKIIFKVNVKLLVNQQEFSQSFKSCPSL